MTDTFYAVSAVDNSGRVADRSIVRVLGWVPGTRLEIREQTGIVVARAARDGVHRIDDRGHLHFGWRCAGGAAIRLSPHTAVQ